VLSWKACDNQWKQWRGLVHYPTWEDLIGCGIGCKVVVVVVVDCWTRSTLAVPDNNSASDLGLVNTGAEAMHANGCLAAPGSVV